MKNEELKDFTVFIMAIAEVYGKRMSDAAILIYFDALKDLEFRSIKGAVKIHCEDPDEGKFMPLPAHIRSRICRPGKDSIIAWRQVSDAYCKYNYYSTVQFQDGTINAVIKDMGGWRWFSSQDLDEPWTQREFERRYDSYKAQRIEIHEPLQGFHEVTNRNNGFLEHVPDCALIADSGQVTMLPPMLPKEITEGQKQVKLLTDKVRATL